ncbi:MAG: class A beta-lactamase-related serine hydrolase [Erysipelotrichaceae bacterium]|nr:class A beta-lactamase-related serine hydrolase [Erysipelotrichaceae bacterium]MDY5252129.1 serine hydrolase [Erysipelotrichaceae bacterium]
MIKKTLKLIVLGIIIGIFLYPFYCWYGYGINIFLNGFIQNGQEIYHYEHGVISVGAKEIDQDKYLFAEDGKMIQGTLVTKNDRFAYFGEDGKMINGNVEIDGIKVNIDDEFQLTKNIQFLENEVRQRFAKEPNVSYSLYYQDLNTGQILTINDQTMYPCSIIKVAVMASVFAEISAGNLTYEQCRSYLWPMITYSDNTSYNILLKMLGEGDGLAGAKKVNENLRTWGCLDTEIHHGLLEGEFYFTDGASNIASPKDIGKIFSLIYEGKIAGREETKQMMEILLACEDNSGLAGGLDQSVAYAHKSGWAYDYYHDGGIIGDDYILVVFTDGALDHEMLMQDISKIFCIYDEQFNSLKNTAIKNTN